MELVGKLKDQVENSSNKEEAKKLIEKAGMKLSDEELSQVSGGFSGRGYTGEEQKEMAEIKLNDLVEIPLNNLIENKLNDLLEMYYKADDRDRKKILEEIRYICRK